MPSILDTFLFQQDSIPSKQIGDSSIFDVDDSEIMDIVNKDGVLSIVQPLETVCRDFKEMNDVNDSELETVRKLAFPGGI